MMPNFVFFKQKTAYEIPKRDWSSDVCSSDLDCHRAADRPLAPHVERLQLLRHARVSPAQLFLERLPLRGADRLDEPALPPVHALGRAMHVFAEHGDVKLRMRAVRGDGRPALARGARRLLGGNLLDGLQKPRALVEVGARRLRRRPLEGLPQEREEGCGEGFLGGRTHVNPLTIFYRPGGDGGSNGLASSYADARRVQVPLPAVRD